MSYVVEYVLVAEDADEVSVLNRLIESSYPGAGHGMEPPFQQLAGFGGSKNPSGDIWGFVANHIAPRLLVGLMRRVQWASPESVQLFAIDEHDESPGRLKEVAWRS